ncbi:MAG: cytochrome c biogenesis protein CcsA [Planctomycetota bacterium]
MNGEMVWWSELVVMTLWLLALGVPRLARCCAWAGFFVGLVLLTALWVHLERPPLRTLGETRLWYALLLALIGLALEWRLRTTVVRTPTLALGALFIGLNLVFPETLDRTLMPALRSPWFVPHVVAYLSAYAVLSLSAGIAAWRWWRRDSDIALPLILVHAGLALLTIGLCLGAIWAKSAWGHYWAWDPKETWALLTWIAYVGVLHGERSLRDQPRVLLALIAGCFLVVLSCWFLVNYLPATAVSVHTYSRQ